jgi:hypothetical protein
VERLVTVSGVVALTEAVSASGVSVGFLSVIVETQLVMVRVSGIVVVATVTVRYANVQVTVNCTVVVIVVVEAYAVSVVVGMVIVPWYS